MDQAQADKNIAQAKAEERRAMAIALEQETRPRLRMPAPKVILAEAEVPLAYGRGIPQWQPGDYGLL
jgi:SigmaW regulon antibacterial